MSTPAGTPPRQRLDLGSSKPSDSSSGRTSGTPRARGASPPPIPVPPAVFLLRFPSPRHAEGLSPSWREGPPVPEAPPRPWAGHVEPRTREIKFKEQAAGAGRDSGQRPQVIPESATPHSTRVAPLTSPATASRSRLTLRHPSQRSTSPHPPGPHEGKLQPVTQSPWPSPRGLACERPRPSQKAQARRVPRKAQEVTAAAGNSGPW